MYSVSACCRWTAFELISQLPSPPSPYKDALLLSFTRSCSCHFGQQTQDSGCCCIWSFSCLLVLLPSQYQELMSQGLPRMLMMQLCMVRECMLCWDT